MKKIYLFLIVTATLCCVACNSEWTDEQYVQTVSFKAVPNDEGVTSVYIRYNTDGEVTYELPILLSGSTMSTSDHTVYVALDEDTLNTLNQERYGTREELYYQLLESQYYTMPESAVIAKGESQTVFPIDFTLGGTNNEDPLDLTDKWLLPLTIVDDDSYDYTTNTRKYYDKALLNIVPFNDFSGTYSATLYMIYLDDDATAFTVDEKKSYVYNDSTIFIYAGTRDEDYTDRKYYKVFIEFTDEIYEGVKYKLNLWSDNDGEDGNAFTIGSDQAYYTIEEEDDDTRPYISHVYITLYMSYSFEDYTISPGNRLSYTVDGTLILQRDLNTLIPDEDQQIQWD